MVRGRITSVTLSTTNEAPLSVAVPAATSRVVRLVDPRPRLDPAQRAAVSYDGPAALVLGAPGTGKTTVAVELLAGRVAAGMPAGSCLVLSSSRTTAEGLRDRLVRRLGSTTTEPLARTPAGLAHAVLREASLRDGGALPRLISGAEQDVILRELLRGHRDGAGRVPNWPAELAAAAATAAFRGEMRDLLMRASELGLDPAGLRELGERTGRPQWVAASTVYQEYEDVLALSRPGDHDPVSLCGSAARRLSADPELARRWRRRAAVLVVDDAQELTAPAARLVEALTGPQTRLVVLADPDATTDGFRGAEPRLPFDLVGSVDPQAPTYVLGTAWRQRGVLRAVTAAVASRIGSAGAGAQRRAQERPEASGALRPASKPACASGAAAVVTGSFTSAEAEADYLADSLRRDHLIDGVLWSELAVITRSAAAADDLRAALTRRGVPVRVTAQRPHLPDEQAVAPLLTIVTLAAELAKERIDAVPTQFVEPLLRSPYGGLDALGWRRLRRTASEWATTDAAAGPGAAAADPIAMLARWLVDGVPRQYRRRHPGLTRVSAMIAGARAAAKWDQRLGCWSARTSASGVLWAAWSAAGIDHAWRDLARRQGAAAARADRDLDVVLALFDAAEWFDEHGAGSGPDGFAERLRALDFTAEPLARRARRDCVEVSTVHAAVGRSWRRVAVAGVQDGTWPDLRLRGSLLGSAELVDVLSAREGGTRAAREAKRSDETRLFHVAVSRATEVLRVTAVDTQEEAPSSLFRAVAEVPGVRTLGVDGGVSDVDSGSGELSLGGVTARLRRLAARHPDATVRDGAARRLAALAVASVPGADPAGWWEPSTCSDDRPRRASDRRVRVSPSSLEDLARCPLRWMTRAAGGARPHPAGPEAVGSLVHEILASASERDPAALRQRLDEAWPPLGLAPGWLERRARGDAEMMLDRAARYLRQAEAQGRREVARELTVTAAVGGHMVTARFDRVEEDVDGRLRVIDFKTGASKPTANQLRQSPQLGAYQVALGTRGRVGGAALVQLGRAANQRLTVQEQAALDETDDPHWAERMIRRSAVTMAAARFEARTGPWCRTCDVVASCPAGGGLR